MLESKRVAKRAAEELKQKFGCAVSEFTKEADSIEVAGVGGRPPRELSRKVLSEIIEPRYVELFELVLAEIQRNGFENKNLSTDIRRRIRRQLLFLEPNVFLNRLCF